ncbi:putative protein kinase RLK-Pelle-LRR-VIII-1 family [Helianthus annuus]|uniref:non-specific serine/threonine protein kinase n=1 Tax=Helianthus annuus TaxID=4232 RepID=A0A9K3NK33_HELAN|nr:putative protein kinase RLK-Pelle-LRR-VIII-1 family [Helianthus annuus]KAJ0912706.1 putative protein kinase RLK-Pelle-LRR-VIII-1 family [Helianthus annuus]
MTLIHVLFEDNQLTGTIPSTLWLAQKLEVLRLDRNLLSGKIPSSINNLKLLKQLYLSNNKLDGPLPNLTSMTFLNYLDISNNSFEPSEIPPWFSSLQSLTTLMMHDTGLQGEVPVDLFHIPQIETVVLRNNQLDGTLDFGESYSESLRLIDVSNNSISAFTQRIHSADQPDLILINNPVCNRLKATPTYCDDPKESNSSYSTPPNNCIPAATCSLDQTSSPNCKCSYPYTGTLTFKATSFSDLGNSSIFTSIQSSMMVYLKHNQLPVDSVSLSNPTMNSDYLVINLEIFPSGDERFNRSGLSQIGFAFSSQTYRPPSSFGPYSFIGNTYNFFSDVSKGKAKSVSTGVIIGGSAGVCVILLLLFIVGLHAYHHKRRAKRSTKMNSPFASWDPDKGSDGCPELKGITYFPFEELNTCTNNFTTTNIGSGGYGMVYRGTLPNGQFVAIKRAKGRPTKVGTEFKTEIELLSRVHHKNLVSLVGFCFDEGEQMLVYEYIVNGSLKDSLSGRSGIRLDWIRRLQIILGAARGLQYLHDHADPPIIHRDVKSTNILLDGHLNAKVSDFGLSKPLRDADRTHVTTCVKGTLGYIDPEYYMTQQLTEKSDVYSFGVVMLELITARNPVHKGKHIVRVVKESMDRNLRELLDPAIGLSTQLQGLERFIDVALRCVEETGNQRPKMSEVVKEIENIMELAGFNPNAESASTLESYGWESNGNNEQRSPLYV